MKKLSWWQWNLIGLAILLAAEWIYSGQNSFVDFAKGFADAQQKQSK